MGVLRRAVLVLVAICCCALAGCFGWTEDQQGNLQSASVMGLPVWKSNKPPAPIKLTDMGMTPEEASKVSGPVLVLPPGQSSKATRYRYYPTGQNNCRQDLAKLLADRASSGATGNAPYCTDTPTAPLSTGNAFVF